MTKEEQEEAERKRVNDEARQKREEERKKAEDLERQQDEIRKQKRLSAAPGSIAPLPITLKPTGSSFLKPTPASTPAPAPVSTPTSATPVSVPANEFGTSPVKGSAFLKNNPPITPGGDRPGSPQNKGGSFIKTTPTTDRPGSPSNKGGSFIKTTPATTTATPGERPGSPANKAGSFIKTTTPGDRPGSPQNKTGSFIKTTPPPATTPPSSSGLSSSPVKGSSFLNRNQSTPSEIATSPTKAVSFIKFSTTSATMPSRALVQELKDKGANKEKEKSQSKESDDDETDEDDEEEDKDKYDKKKKKQRTPEEELRRHERRERRQKEREAKGLGPETKEERRQRREEARKRKTEIHERKERKLKEREDSMGSLPRDSSSKRLHKHREGSEKNLHKSKSKQNVDEENTSTAPIITTTPSTSTPRSMITKNDDSDDEKKLQSFLRVKGQAGRRLPSRASHRMSLPVGVKIAPINPTSTSATSSSTSGKGGSVLDIAIKAQEKHKQQEKEERREMMKRLAEGRATREEQAGSSDTRPYASPESNPLLNGLASLALEAAQKKNSAGSPLLRPNFAESRTRRQSTPIKPSPRLVDDASQYRTVLRQTAEAPARARLIHCKGKKRICIREADPTAASLNNTDSGSEGSGLEEGESECDCDCGCDRELCEEQDPELVDLNKQKEGEDRHEAIQQGVTEMEQEGQQVIEKQHNQGEEQQQEQTKKQGSESKCDVRQGVPPPTEPKDLRQLLRRTSSAGTPQQQEPDKPKDLRFLLRRTPSGVSLTDEGEGDKRLEPRPQLHGPVPSLGLSALGSQEFSDESRAKLRGLSLSPRSPKLEGSPKSPHENATDEEKKDARSRFRRTVSAPSLNIPRDRKRLIHCTGKRRIHIRETTPVVASLNNQDVFVLDCGTANPTIYVWNGPKSTLAKKSKGSAVAEIFKNHERGGHATVVKIENGADDPAFWAALGGGSAKGVQDKWPLGTDEDAEKLWASDMKLYRVNIGYGDIVTFDLVFSLLLALFIPFIRLSFFYFSFYSLAI
eukprot:Phypoly_transcript_00350.p1 GENE.Phypoly_transcript_00350~~Phypoly_transcript_00350.p1  ORF type:complete len:1120 (+),score=308.48 Phypoly_transcript_00350:281-3361(+)